MSKKSEPPLWIDVKQSRYLLVFIIVVHAVTALSCLMLPLTIAIKVLFLFLPGYSLYFYLQRYKQGFYTLMLKYSEQFSWELVEHDNFISMRVLKSTVLTPFVIILHVEIDKKYRSILVCRDAVSAEKYRQLFVALKIMKLE